MDELIVSLVVCMIALIVLVILRPGVQTSKESYSCPQYKLLNMPPGHAPRCFSCAYGSDYDYFAEKSNRTNGVPNGNPIPMF